MTDGPTIRREVDEPPPPSDPASERPPGVKLKLNEVMLENIATVADETGAFPPWVEIYNPSEVAFSTAGVALSDDFLAPKKWQIPAIPAAVIQPRGFLLIWLDGQDALGGLHTNFQVVPGRRLTLLLGGAVDDKIIGFDASRLGADQSVGRSPDGAEPFGQLESPTPGAANAVIAEPEDDVFIRGDANADERVNVSDMVTILRIIGGGQRLPVCQDRADANDDGTVNLTDPVFLSEAIFGDSTTIPPPYPGPDVDPTPDGLVCERQ